MAEVFWRQSEKRGIGRWCSEGPQALAGWGYAGCLGRVILGCGAAMQDLGYELPRIPIPRTPVNRPPGNASGPPGGIIDVAIAWEMNASWQEKGGGSCRVVGAGREEVCVPRTLRQP